MDDKNVVKKRVTLAIAFAVFLLAVIVIIVLIKPVIFNVLCEYMSRYYGKNVIVLLDEYDTPMQEAYFQ